MFVSFLFVATALEKHSHLQRDDSRCLMSITPSSPSGVLTNSLSCHGHIELVYQQTGDTFIRERQSGSFLCPIQQELLYIGGEACEAPTEENHCFLEWDHRSLGQSLWSQFLGSKVSIVNQVVLIRVHWDVSKLSTDQSNEIQLVQTTSVTYIMSMLRKEKRRLKRLLLRG